MSNTIALIPARSGSQRIKDKNIRELAGHPLLAYTIQVAKDSGLFDSLSIFVVTDSQDISDIARKYEALTIFETPISGGQDSWWINQALTHIAFYPDKYFILRPTSPFRTVEMLQRAEYEFTYSVFPSKHNYIDYPIMKAIEPVSQRPEKMWRKNFDEAHPYIKGGYHYEPSHTFEDLYIQNASLEIRKYGVPMPLDGPIIPFITYGYEGFDINDEDDWMLAETLIERGLAKLPEIKI